MKKTLLSIVQDILSDMDSEEINSLGDSAEAMQVAKVVETTYYNLFSNKMIPEFEQLVKLTAASDSEFPTHFKLDSNVKRVDKVWYKDTTGIYREVCWLRPLDFLRHIDYTSSNYKEVEDKKAGTTLRITNNKHPEYYTSFDDEWIVMNSWDLEVDDTLQNSKVRAYGQIYPVFSIEDSFIPDIDSNLFPYLIAEAKATCMSLFKGGADPKVEQAARRLKSARQNDMLIVGDRAYWNDFGRK